MSYKIGADADTGQPLITHAGGTHGLGCRPRKLCAPGADGYPPLSAAFPDIPSAKWTEQDFEPFCIPVQDQGQTSACGPFSLIEAMGTAFALAGDERPLLSAWFAYGLTNGGQDGGTALPDLLQAAEKTGLPLDTSVKRGNMFGPYPQSDYVEAQRFRIEAAYDTPALSNICSAAERNQVGITGIDIGENFNPDAGGFLPPFQPGPQVLGHALSVIGKKYAQGFWWPKIRNHWRPSWGLNGCAYLHPSYIQPMFGGWTIKVTRLDPNDPNKPPVAA